MSAESVDVTAGLGGFLAFFVLGVALYFLMRNMNARMRRMAYRAELEAQAGQGTQAEPVDGPDDAGTPAAADQPEDDDPPPAT